MAGCCFIGHKKCPEEIRIPLLENIKNLISNGVVDFYVGTQGDFDRTVYNVLREIKKTHSVNIYVVLAYLHRAPETPYFNMCDTIFPDELTTTPIRFAIRRRNSYMINKSDYVIAYLDSPFSNTIVNIEEALKKKKRIINLGKYNIDKITV